MPRVGADDLNIFISSINNSIKMSIKAHPDARDWGGGVGEFAGAGGVGTYVELHPDSAGLP